ncbi:MAG: hypothetical protein SGCHY_001762, partial [Lobulomycetales sp.]
MAALKLLLPYGWRNTVASWLIEDTPSLDFGGYVVGDAETSATLWMKSPEAILAGVPFFDEIFRLLDCRVEWQYPEGSELVLSGKDRISVATVYGKANAILLGERVALNMLSRASGIALRANLLNRLKDAHGWKGAIAGTRKTTPGFRIVEKYAMIVGGCDAHRYDLSSMIMLK